MALTKERLGEIAVAELKAQVVEDLDGETLTPSTAEDIVKDIVNKKHTWVVRGGITRDEAFDFALYLMPDDESRRILDRAITKLTGTTTG